MRKNRKSSEISAERRARLIAEETEIERKLDAAYGPSMSHEESMAFLRSLGQEKIRQKRNRGR